MRQHRSASSRTAKRATAPTASCSDAVTARSRPPTSTSFSGAYGFHCSRTGWYSRSRASPVTVQPRGLGCSVSIVGDKITMPEYWEPINCALAEADDVVELRLLSHLQVELRRTMPIHEPIVLHGIVGAVTRCLNHSRLLDTLQLASVEMSFEDAKRLSKGLLNASSLMTLILSGCPIGDTCFSILLPSLRSLVRNRFLRIIDLTDCQLTDKSASSISQLLEPCGVENSAWVASLRKDPSSCNPATIPTPRCIDPTKFLNSGEPLTTHHKHGLSFLSLRRNHISDLTVAAILSVLCENSTLGLLDIRGIPATESELWKLQAFQLDRRVPSNLLLGDSPDYDVDQFPQTPHASVTTSTQPLEYNIEDTPRSFSGRISTKPPPMQHPTQQNLPQQIHSQCKIYAIVQAPTGRLYRGLDLHKPCTTIPDALFKRIVTRSLPHRRSNSCHAWVEAASTFCVPTSQSTPSSEVLLQSLKRMEIRALSAESRAFFEILDCAFTKQKLKNFSTSRVPTPRQRRTETDSNPQPHPSTQQPEHHRTRNCTSNATATSATTPISMGLRNVLERLEFIEQQTGNPTQAQQALGLLSNMIQHMNKVLDLLETKNNT